MAAFTTSYAWFAIRGTTITPIVFTSPPRNIAIAASTPFITILRLAEISFTPPKPTLADMGMPRKIVETDLLLKSKTVKE